MSSKSTPTNSKVRKMNKKKKISKKIKSEEENIEKQNEQKVKALSERSDIFQNIKSNLEKLNNLKINLEIKEHCQEIDKAMTQFHEENNEILKIYENEEKMQENLDKNISWTLNDDLFEDRVLQILSETYDLKEYNIYPYFDVGYSKTKKSNVIKIYYDQIEIKFDNTDHFYALCFDERENYMIEYKNIPMIMEKYEGEWNNVTVITKDYKSSIDFEFIKKGNTFETSFSLIDLNQDLIEIKNKINKK